MSLSVEEDKEPLLPLPGTKPATSAAPTHPESPARHLRRTFAELMNDVEARIDAERSRWQEQLSRLHPGLQGTPSTSEDVD